MELLSPERGGDLVQVTQLPSSGTSIICLPAGRNTCTLSPVSGGSPEDSSPSLNSQVDDFCPHARLKATRTAH